MGKSSRLWPSPRPPIANSLRPPDLTRHKEPEQALGAPESPEARSSKPPDRGSLPRVDRAWIVCPAVGPRSSLASACRVLAAAPVAVQTALLAGSPTRPAAAGGEGYGLGAGRPSSGLPVLTRGACLLVARRTCSGTHGPHNPRLDRRCTCSDRASLR